VARHHRGGGAFARAAGLTVCGAAVAVWVGRGVAATILHADRWSAGQALMKSTNPTGWEKLAAEINLAEANHDVLSACREAAARTKKEQRCTIVVLAP
jgi:hypothetical protein